MKTWVLVGSLEHVRMFDPCPQYFNRRVSDQNRVGWKTGQLVFITSVEDMIPEISIFRNSPT